jgi:hypothetical protein
MLKKRRSDLSNMIGAALGSALVMFAFWQTFDPRVILIFIGFLTFSEVFVRIRWRLQVVCRHCGFDPVLYVKDPSLAAERARVFLVRRKADPSSMLKNPLNIPFVVRPRTAEKKSSSDPTAPAKTDAAKGRLVSKQI